MLRVWGKLFDDKRMCADAVIENDERELSFDERFACCTDELVRLFDLPKPIWLPQNLRELERFGRTDFRQEHFVEAFPYRYFEIEIIETDDDEEE